MFLMLDGKLFIERSDVGSRAELIEGEEETLLKERND
jgi:hypothetical protein